MALSITSTVTLRQGIEMPRFGLGTYKDTAEQARDAVAAALGMGYRLVDTASLYDNEEGVARGIEDAGVSRDQIFITSKVWNDEQGYEETKAALDRSLARLGTDYLDLYLVHWPIRSLLKPTWSALEDALAEEKVRAIGVSNFLEPHLEELFKIAEVLPFVDQIEFHPHLQQPDVQKMLAENGIVLQAWAPLIRGRVNLIPELVAIAQAHDKTPAQVALRWILQLGHVTIPKSTHAERIRENADIFDFELTEAEMDTIAKLDQDTRIGPDPHVMAWEG